MDTLNTALQLARNGIAVVPLYGISGDGSRCLCKRGPECPSKGKHPIPHQWEQAPFPSGADIHEWFTGNPTANLGGRTGSISGNIFVVDFDEGGREAFAPLVHANGGIWPETLVTRTGRGGEHFFYRAPQGVRIPNSVSKIAHHVDIRGEGGQVVLPPSRTNYGNYTIVHSAGIADAPPWLVEHILAMNATPVTNAPQAAPKRPQDAEDVAKERNMLRSQLGRLREKRSKVWAPGDAWDITCFEVACHLVELANSEWAALTHESAYQLYMEAAPFDDRWDEREKCWRQAVEKTAGKAKEPPTPLVSVMDMGTEAPRPSQAAPAAAPVSPADIQNRVGGGIEGGQINGVDSAVIARFCNEALLNRFLYTHEQGWYGWDGRVWKMTPGVWIEEQFRLWCTNKVAESAAAGDDVATKFYAQRLSTGKIESIPKRARGAMLVSLDVFDQHPDLLNVRNGVVNLATGQLLEHNPGYLLTKITEVEYHPGATHPDWDVALQAVPAPVADWMQLRLGQAATGYPTWDDLLPICQGGGENGKSTFVAGVRRALGGHAGVISEKVLMGGPNEHSTELTDLRGMRLAIIEETRQDSVLNIKRLKDILGTSQMTARRIRENTMTWIPTHSLFLTTNYTPKVVETDHGTWRRLALVRFPFKYVKDGEPLRNVNDRRGDINLRSRIEAGDQGQHQAILAWVVQGAIRWYASGKGVAPQPQEVITDTAAWRAETDRIHGFLEEFIEFDPTGKVLSTDLYEEFSHYLAAVGAPGWAENTFVQRLREHPLVHDRNVTKRRTAQLSDLSRPGNVYREFAEGQKAMVWLGMRWKPRAEKSNVTPIEAWR